MAWVAVVVFTAIVLSGCGPLPDPAVDLSPPPVEERPGVGCAEMCAHLQELGCQQGEPIDDESCTDYCRSSLKDGLDLHPECVIEVKTCDEVDPASQGC